MLQYIGVARSAVRRHGQRSAVDGLCCTSTLMRTGATEHLTALQSASSRQAQVAERGFHWGDTIATGAARVAGCGLAKTRELRESGKATRAPRVRHRPLARKQVAPGCKTFSGSRIPRVPASCRHRPQHTHATPPASHKVTAVPCCAAAAGASRRASTRSRVH